MTEAERKHLFGLIGQIKARSKDYMHGWINGRFRHKSLNELTDEEYNRVIQVVEFAIKHQKTDEPVDEEFIREVIPDAEDITMNKFDEIRDQNEYLKK